MAEYIDTDEIIYNINGSWGNKYDIYKTWYNEENIEINVSEDKTKLIIKVECEEFWSNQHEIVTEKKRIHNRIKLELEEKKEERCKILEKCDNDEATDEDLEDLKICNGLIKQWTAELKDTAVTIINRKKTTNRTFEIPENTLYELEGFEGYESIWFLWVKNIPKIESIIASVDDKKEICETTLEELL
jgi:hypothetical protein